MHYVNMRLAMKKPTLKRTTVFLTDDQLKRLAKTAEGKGINVAQLIRIYVSAGLDEEIKR